MNLNLQLTPGQRRSLALLLLLLLTGLVVALFAVPTLWLHRHYDDAIEDYADKLVRYRRFAEQAPAIQAEIARIEALNPRKFYSKTNNPALAASEIQESLKQLVESRKGKLISLQVLPPKEEGKYRRIAISIQASVSTLALQQILHGIETREPHLFIDTMSIRAGQGRQYRPMPGIEPEFGLQMTVHGYAINDPS